MIYKRGCNKKGPDKTCSKCGKRRACGVYWYKFMWSGKLVRESTKQGNDKVARQMEAAHRTSLAKGEVGIRDKKAIPTLKNFCIERVEPWAKSSFEHASPKTWLWYRFGIDSLKHSKTLAKLKLNEIGPELVAEYASERQRDGLQISSVNSCLRALRRVLRLALEWGVIEASPKVKFLSGEHRRERVITSKEEALYLAAALPLLHDVSVILFDTGMRPEECHCLRWENINRDAGRNGVLLITKGKTKAARRVLPLSPRVRVVLGNRWKLAGEPGEGWVWSAETKDGHINHDSVKLQHKKALNLAKIRPFEVYSIRHTFLTRLGESGCDVWTLARIAGHSNISISQRYVHPSEDAVLNALSRLSGHNSGHSAENVIPAGSGELLLNTANREG
jgi:integrase